MKISIKLTSLSSLLPLPLHTGHLVFMFLGVKGLADINGSTKLSSDHRVPRIKL